MVDVYGANFLVDTSMDTEQLSEYVGDENIVGHCNYYKRQIFVANDQSEHEQNRTWLHEVLETLKFMFNLEDKLGEEDICNLEKGLGYTLEHAGFQYPKIGS